MKKTVLLVLLASSVLAGCVFVERPYRGGYGRGGYGGYYGEQAHRGDYDRGGYQRDPQWTRDRDNGWNGRNGY